MQAAMQTNQLSLAIQAHANIFSNLATQSQLSNAGAFGARDSSSRMSNMLSNYSKATFAMSNYASGNDASSSFMAQSMTISRSSSYAQPPARCDRRDDPYGGRGNTQRDCRIDIDYREHDRTPPRNDSNCCGTSNGTQWSNTAVTNNKASIDLGDYKLNFNKADSSMVMTNAKTGDTTKIYGDPHIDQHANSGNKSSAMFNGPMTFTLPDTTKITVGTQAAKNNPKVSFADDVTITRGNQGYVVKGLSEQNSAGLTIQKSRDGRQLDNATPDGYTLVAARDGTGWIDPTTGKQPTQSDFNRAKA
ncbi:DUF1521 domain-containing protein [Paraburkholderia caffeinilytica]|uniref:DUF1521 domain-containing protein n=1 Tax=Paraburkholderia caffeinilytica TaxID=1761016 RepID=A0ABQ1LZA6_9BURK|nr:DUF1521 domain-containing protein [Paraburkholderia caffeinilytica]GGC32166.1 hypothetical protein GCM10011400_18530 [Paraburkholderia caffeinilytica]CAB3796493.1 hypothetical protein LMG28690_04341 [Paraburkholderia caffeinilytica]